MDERYKMSVTEAKAILRLQEPILNGKGNDLVTAAKATIRYAQDELNMRLQALKGWEV